MPDILGGSQFLNPTELIDTVGLSEGDIVGDLGCGSGGYFVIPFANRVGATGRVYAVDILPEALEAVRRAAVSENLGNVITVWSDLEKPGATDIPPRSLDVAFLKNVLFQSIDKEAMLAEAARLVKPHGKLVVVDWSSGTGGFGPVESKRVSPSAVDVIVKKMGFERLAIYDLGAYHFCLIYKRR